MKITGSYKEIDMTHVVSVYHGPESWTNPDVVLVTVNHPNQINPKWLKGYGILLVFMYTPMQSASSLAKAVRRLKKNLRKVYSRDEYKNRINSLVLHYIWSGNSEEALKAYQRAVMAPLENPVNYSWFAPAGLDRGFING